MYFNDCLSIILSTRYFHSIKCAVRILCSTQITLKITSQRQQMTDVFSKFVCFYCESVSAEHCYADNSYRTIVLIKFDSLTVQFWDLHRTKTTIQNAIQTAQFIYNFIRQFFNCKCRRLSL